MLIYEGYVLYKENEQAAYFSCDDLQNHLLIIIGKTLEETFVELTENRGVRHGTKLKVTGEVDYYEPIDNDVLFCRQFDLL